MTPPRGFVTWARAQSVAVRLVLLALGVVVALLGVIAGTLAWFTLWGHPDLGHLLAAVGVLALLLVLCAVAAVGRLAWVLRDAPRITDAMDRRDR